MGEHERDKPSYIEKREVNICHCDTFSHTLPLQRVNEALRYLHEKIKNPIRVVVTFDE
jgi:hypothetical protein